MKKVIALIALAAAGTSFGVMAQQSGNNVRELLTGAVTFGDGLNMAFTDSVAYSYWENNFPAQSDEWYRVDGQLKLIASTGYEWNADGFETLVWSGVRRDEREYDSENRMIEQRIYETDNEGVSVLSRKYVWAYNDQGLLLKRENYRLPYGMGDVTEIAMEYSETNEYSPDGRKVASTVFNYSMSEPGMISWGTKTLYTYDDDTAIKYPSTIKTSAYNVTTGEWADMTVTEQEFEFYPVTLSTPDYLSSVVVTDAQSGDTVSVSKTTVEYDDLKMVLTVSTKTKARFQSDEHFWSYYLRPNASVPGAYSQVIAQEKSYTVNDAIEAYGSYDYNYDDDFKLISRNNYSKTRRGDGEWQTSGAESEYEYDNLGRMINNTYKLKHVDIDFYYVQQQIEYEYAGDTEAVTKYLRHYRSSPDQEEPMITCHEVEYDTELPFDDIRFYYGNVIGPIRLYYKPLKSWENGVMTRYNYRTLESSLNRVDAGNGGYAVWPTLATDRINVVVPEGIKPDVRIYSAGGTLVNRTDNEVVSVEALQPGVYIADVNGHIFRIIKR